MAERRVRQTGKKDGDITSLCNAGQPWSPRETADAISDIESGTHSYFVDEAGDKARVKVVDGPSGKYLRTTGDSESQNNLDNLPDC